jgi:predicted site-specific integrase-resolvase
MADIYMRVSTVDQHPESQLHDLRQMAAQRGYAIVNEYTDRISGVKAKRPGLDQMMADARHGKSIRQIARDHSISAATVQRVLRKPPAQVGCWKQAKNPPEPCCFAL